MPAEFLFDPPSVPSVPITGGARRFPVRIGDEESPLWKAMVLGARKLLKLKWSTVSQL